MNKARRKSNRRASANRLVSESLLLSTVRNASSRAVRFFQAGKASRFLTSVKKTDSLAERRIVNPLLKRAELHKNSTLHYRNRFASFCSKNKFFKSLSSIRISLLNSTARSVGIFLLTFGIYAMAVILLKRYVDLPLDATADDLIVSALATVAGVFLAVFGDKSNIEILGGGKILGSLFSGVLGVNDSSLEKIPSKQPKTGVSIGFLLGSVCGALTVFSSPLGIMLILLCVAMLAAIMCIPEFGLLLTVAVFAALPIKWVSLIAFVTLFSYVIKCLRLKRNFTLGTSDFLMLVLLLLTPFFGVGVQGVSAKGGGYLMCGMALYFVARNLICTKKLLLQAFNALCVGSFCGMVLYIVGEFSSLIPHSEISAACGFVSRNALNADMLAVIVAICLPFALSSFSCFGTQNRNLLYLVVAIVCAAVSGSLAFCLLIAVSACVFAATAYKAPVGALISAALVIILMMAYGTLFDYSRVVTPFAKLGFDKTLGLSWDFAASSFWGGFNSLNGIVCTVLAAAVVILSLQRIFAATVLKHSEKNTLLCGTVASGAVMSLVSMSCFNLLADMRTLAILWFVFGLSGAAYTVLFKNDVEEV
ncbi:MAG: hypothetical protein E7586_06185 [Ruminococcaceae bacterium]|nr:hypothetical protein [Oscillospiraceae bacterium]